MFYDLKVTYGNLELYYHEDLSKAAYCPNVMKIWTRLQTVPTYALDWAAIVAHIPWISRSINFGLFYGTLYVEVGNFSGPKLEGKNSHCLIFLLKKKRKAFLENWHLLMPVFWVANLHRNQRG